MNIYISNLNFDFQEKDLNRIFNQYGDVTSAKIIVDKETNRSRGFGFVEMPDDEASKKAINELDGTTIDGRTVRVSEAREKWDKPEGRPDRDFNNSRSYNQNQY